MIKIISSISLGIVYTTSNVRRPIIVAPAMTYMVPQTVVTVIPTAPVIYAAPSPVYIAPQPTYVMAPPAYVVAPPAAYVAQVPVPRPVR